MHFSTEDADSLKTYLGDVVASESDADPQVLAEFMYALLQSDSPREVLLARCTEELSVFLEEKTNDIVKRVFSALDDKSYLPKESQSAAAPTTSSSSPSVTTSASAAKSDTNTQSQSATSRSYGEDDNDDEDDDDDTNFKRRSHKPNATPTESTSSTDHTQKRSFQADDGSETGRMMKLSRGSTSGQYNPLQKRLGGIRRVKKRCFDYDNKGYCMRGDLCPYEHGDDRVIVEANNNNVMESLNSGHNGSDGGGPMRIGGRGGGLVGGRGGMNRSGSNKRQEEVPYTSRYTPYSTKIVVENIPQDHCNIDSVTEFFGKFGKLVNLSVQADASRAFLQYASHQEAMAAYQSPAVIFNNRFVKVFWKKVDEEEERKEFMEQQRLASLPDPEAIKAKAAQLAKEKEERQKKQQEHMKKILEVQRHKQQLMEKQIEEHKRLLEQLGQTPPGSKERQDIMSAINHLSTLISSNKTPTTTATSPLSNTGSHHPSSSSSSPPSSQQSIEGSIPPAITTMDAKKAEMEKLKAKLASLEAAKASGYSSHHGGRGGMNAWSSRGARSYSLDNRKKTTTPPTAATSGTIGNQENDTKKVNEDASNTESKEGSEAAVEPKEI